MARRRGHRIPVYVTFNGLKYGFQTQQAIHESYKGELGQTTYAGAAGVVFGANSPKPNRASKLFEAGTISSFCSSDKEKTLRAANWVIDSHKSGRRGLKTSGLSRTVFVPMPGGYNYAWNITAAELAEVGVLGIEEATADSGILVWGSSPKPPRASKMEGGSRVSTFIKPQQSVINAAVEAGWSVKGVDYELLPSAAGG